MEYILLSSLFALGFLSIFLHGIITFIMTKCCGGTIRSSRLPPGNYGWPLIGESIEFTSTMQQGCPEKFIHDRMKKYAPTQAIKTSILGENMTVLNGPLANKLLFSNENKLVVTWWPPTIEKVLISGRPSSEASKGRRTNLVQFLNPEGLRQYVSKLQNIVVDHLKEEWFPKSKVTVYPLAKWLSFTISCRCFISIEDSAHITKLSHVFYDVIAGVIAVPLNIPGTTYHRAIKAANKTRVELLEIIRQLRNQTVAKEIKLGKEYLFAQMVLETDENGEFLPQNDVCDDLLSVMVASHDSSCSLITSIVYYLADHPHIYAKVLEEQIQILKSKEQTESSLTMEDIHKMKYSRNVVDEALRIASPAPGNFKKVIADFTFGGYTIPKGWKVFISSHAIHRNEKYFSDPKKFDPSRFEGKGPEPFTFIPFGGGPRICPGRDFARLEVLVFMHCLVTKFYWEKIIPNEKMKFKPIAIPEKHLPIRLIPHGN